MLFGKTLIRLLSVGGQAVREEKAAKMAGKKACSKKVLINSVILTEMLELGGRQKLATTGGKDRC